MGGSAPEEVGDDYDELLPAAIEVVVETGMASVSMLQRRLKLGYSRAARLVDQMEEKGVVGPFEGSKPRQVLITKEQWQEMQFKQGMVDAAPEGVPDELEFEGDARPPRAGTCPPSTRAETFKPTGSALKPEGADSSKESAPSRFWYAGRLAQADRLVFLRAGHKVGRAFIGCASTKEGREW